MSDSDLPILGWGTEEHSIIEGLSMVGRCSILVA